MASNQPGPTHLRLRYKTASIFERADTRSPEVGHLEEHDAFTVLGAEGEFYHVQLPSGMVGFVYAHSVVGTDMPLTDREQHNADERAAEAAKPTGGWRGALDRLRH